MKVTTISQAFSKVDEPRHSSYVRHPLINIITIAICAVICGCDDFYAMEEFGKSKIKWFRKLLDLKHGIPSHDTFNDVLNRLEPKQFHDAFTRWVNTISQHKEKVIALDGKVMRGTLDKASGASAIHLVSAWSVENGLCLGQEKVADKSNEVTAIPVLIELLNVEGATITTDAMGCQHKIGQQITEKNADYLFGLKGNQGLLHEDVELYLQSQLQQGFQKSPHSFYKSVDGDHGRIESREVWVVDDVSWLRERHPNWQHMNSIAMVRSKREIGPKSNTEYRYYISSHKGKEAQFIAEAIRHHWHVENKLHWQLDVSFNEDKNRSRSGFSAQNVAVLNKIALNLLKNEKSVKVGVKNKRLKAGWDSRYLMKVLMAGFATG